LLPFVGLRPFEASDRQYFRGRATHVDEVLQRLGMQRLVAVVGLSGSGKSSLVRAGVIPALQADRLKDSSSEWIVAMITPEAAPLSRLAAELTNATWEYTQSQPAYVGHPMDDWAVEVFDALLSGRRGLCTAIERSHLPARVRVLLVIDQFEELFRYQQREERDDAEVFIEQLLEAARDKELNTYVILTMRSEWLGECARYDGLAEAVNSGLYLTPRLDRLQLAEAIIEPVGLGGRTIDPGLVQRLINDVADDQDQLPVLQHALMCCWKRGGSVIDQALFESVGGIDALDRHAEGVLKELAGNDDLRSHHKVQIAEQLFKRITKPGSQEGIRDSERDGVRDAATLGQICRASGFARPEMVEVIEAFRKQGRAFLRPGEPTRLKDDSVIDITHESLIRKWKRLQQWVQDEARSVEVYRQLLRDAQQAVEGRPLREWDVPAILRESRRWSAAWAERYGGGYAQAMAHLRFSEQFYAERKATIEREAREKREADERRRVEESERRHQEELRKKQAELDKFRMRRTTALLGASVVVLGLAGYLYTVWTTVSSTVRSTKAYYRLAGIASDVDESLERRVAASLGGFQVAQTLASQFLSNRYIQSNTPTLDVGRDIPLDQWELFSSLVGESVWQSEPEMGSRPPLVHSGSVAVDSSRRHIAVAGGGYLRLWALQQPLVNSDRVTLVSKIELPLAEHVRFSPDGQELLAAGGNVIRHFAIRPPANLRELDVTPDMSTGDRQIFGLSFIDGPDKYAYFTSDGRLQFGSGRNAALNLARSHDELTYAIFSPNGRYLFLAFRDATRQLVELGKIEAAPQVIEARLNTFDTPTNIAFFSPNSSWIVMGSEGGEVEARPTNDTLKAASFERLDSSVSAATITDSGLVGAGSSTGKVYVFGASADLANALARSPSLPFRPTVLFDASFGAKGETAPLRWLQFSDTADTIAVASGRYAAFFDLRRRLPTMRVTHALDVVHASLVASNTVLSASQDGLVRISSSLQSTQDAPCRAEASAVSSREEWAVACSGVLQIGQPFRELSRGTLEIVSVKFSRDGNHLAWIQREVPDQYVVHFAERSESPLAWKQTAKELAGPGTGRAVLAVSEDGRWVAAAFEKPADPQKLVRPWDIQIFEREDRGELRLAFGPIPVTSNVSALSIDKSGSLAFGTTKVTGQNPIVGSLQYYRHDRGSWKKIDVKRYEGIEQLGPTAIAFEPTHQRLIVALADGTIQLVPLQGQEELKPFPDRGDAVREFYTNDSGTTLAAVSGRQIRFFSLDDDVYRQTLSLNEIDIIQALAFVHGNRIVTSVARTDRELVMNRHDISVVDQVRALCKSLPMGEAQLKDLITNFWSDNQLGEPPNNLCPALTTGNPSPPPSQ
jgi:WD40 repeat protein